MHILYIHSVQEPTGQVQDLRLKRTWTGPEIDKNKQGQEGDIMYCTQEQTVITLHDCRVMVQSSWWSSRSSGSHCGRRADSHGRLGDSRDSVGDSRDRVGDSRVRLGDWRGCLGDCRGLLGDSRGRVGDSRGRVGDRRGRLGS